VGRVGLANGLGREPSIEWVARAVHSTGGRIGTHMSLRVPSWDLEMTPWG
jgi:hypothetical protein